MDEEAQELPPNPPRLDQETLDRLTREVYGTLGEAGVFTGPPGQGQTFQSTPAPAVPEAKSFADAFGGSAPQQTEIRGWDDLMENLHQIRDLLTDIKTIASTFATQQGNP